MIASIVDIFSTSSLDGPGSVECECECDGVWPFVSLRAGVGVGVEAEAEAEPAAAGDGEVEAYEGRWGVVLFERRRGLAIEEVTSEDAEGSSTSLPSVRVCISRCT